MKKEPLVSVIIPTYNREKKLPKAINSVIKQTYKKWELIVVDDRSTDDTQELVKRYVSKDKRIRYVKNTHKQGPSGARNQGMELAKGKYIAFLDSDDEWLKHHLKESVAVLDKGTVDLCASLVYERTKGKLISILRENELKRAIRHLKPIIKNKKFYYFDYRLCEYWFWNKFRFSQISTFIFKKDILTEAGYFNEGLFAGEDMEFLYRLLISSNLCFIKDHHSIYNEGEDNLSYFRGPCDIQKQFFLEKQHIKTRRAIKNNLKKFKKLNTCNVIKGCNKCISSCYFSIGYINRKTNKLKSLYYYLISLCYYYDPIQLKAIKKLFIPSYYKK